MERSPEAPAHTRRVPSDIVSATPNIQPLGSVSWPRDAVGGKANGLRDLSDAGLSVPRAFVITATAFWDVIDAVVVEATTLGELRELVRAADLPVELYQEIETHLGGIGPGPFAVRSSGLEEDGAEHSFAGQHLTVLDVRGLSAVVDAVKQVWAEGLSDAVLEYRARLAVDAVPAGMAVIVQEMVKPRVAGVAFTANPLTQDPSEMVVCAASGLGTSVVGGEACDTYYVERPSGYLRRSETHEDCLGVEDLMRLVRVAERAERAFGCPVDIEWAFDGLEFRALQARPITGTQDERVSVWTNTNVGEALPGAATPLTWSIIRRFSRRGFERAFGSLGLDVPADYELVGSFSGRVYLNLTQFASITSQIPVLEPQTLFEMAGGGGVELVNHIYEQRSPAKFLMRLPATVPRIAASQALMPVVAPLWDAAFRGLCEAFFAKNLDRLNHSALAEELARLDTIFDWNGEIMLACASNFLMSYVAVREVLRLFGAPSAHERTQDLLAGMEVSSAEPGRALLRLGHIARRSRRLRRLIAETDSSQTLEALKKHESQADVRLFLDELERFRGEFGHRAPREAELATPRWREDTTFLFEILRGFIDAPHLATRAEIERDRKRALAQVDSIIDHAFALGGGTAFRALLGFMRANARRRETLRGRVVDAIDMYRRFFLEVGARLQHRGDLRVADDVFFLTVDEVREWLEDPQAARTYRYRVLVRRALYEAFAARPDPPNIFTLRGTEILAEPSGSVDEEDGADGDFVELRGLAASVGRATGPARVVRTPEEAHRVKPGEILILPYADVGWTPMFLTARAVVMELGGPLSHAAIVAREYGLPAVVNARGALEAIQDGDLVTVDGSRGLVVVKPAKA